MRVSFCVSAKTNCHIFFLLCRCGLAFLRSTDEPLVPTNCFHRREKIACSVGFEDVAERPSAEGGLHNIR
jgi:hypothetical protein